MNPHPNPPSETPRSETPRSETPRSKAVWPSVRNPQSLGTVPEGRYKARGTHRRRAPILAGLALIALAVVSILLGWYGGVTFLCAFLGSIYVLLAMVGKP